MTRRVTGADSVGPVVVDVVCQLTAATPDELPTLYDAVDVDAVEALLAGSDESLRLTFRYAGCRIEIDGDGLVTGAEVDD